MEVEHERLFRNEYIRDKTGTLPRHRNVENVSNLESLQMPGQVYMFRM